jgi:23S rRNA G2069 N7-methylase RlmK/C1962 C5-methylase RlmI
VNTPALVNTTGTPGGRPIAAQQLLRARIPGIEWLPDHDIDATTSRAPVAGRRPLRRALWRILQRLRFALWQHRRHDRLVLERGLGFPVVVLPGVFNPTLFLSTGVLVDHLDRHPLPHGCSALDLGTGSGAFAVAAARTAGRVVAVDVNAEAVRCARLNLLLNRVDDRAEVRHGDLFEAVVGMRFDRILCNPPYYPGSPSTELERAFVSDDFAQRFAAALPDHLSSGGCALVVLSEEGDEAGFLAAFDAAALRVDEVERQQPFGEVIRIFRVSREGDALSELP